MRFPLSHTIGLHTYSAGAQSDYETSSPVYTPVKSAVGTQKRVYGWGPTRADEPAIAGQDRVVTELDLFVPPEFACKPQDLIDVDGAQYEVVGHLQDYSHGPFGWQPGKVVKLKRVEG